jgi:hypothetical protein
MSRTAKRDCNDANTLVKLQARCPEARFAWQGAS